MPRIRVEGTVGTPVLTDHLLIMYRKSMKKETNTPLNFWAKVETKSNDECWNWRGSTTRDGYGTFTMNYKTHLTHRLAWELRNGKIPKGKYLLHKCDNRKCCNPNHLILGTQQENVNDMIKKGRQKSLKRGGKKNLTDDEVRDIKTLYSSKKYTQEQLSEIYGVSRMQISLIILGKSHAHVIQNKIPIFTIEYDDELPPEE